MNQAAIKSALDGKSDSSHMHSYIKDSNDSSTITFAYSKAGMNYGDYTWLAGWNGKELRAINKNQFATSGHTHRRTAYVGSDTANTAGWYKVADQTMSGYENSNILFAVTNTYAGNLYGLFTLRIRSNNTNITCDQACWLTRTGFPVDSIIVNVSGMKWTMYVNKTVSQYGRIQFEILSEGSINSASSNAVLYNSSTPESTKPTATVTSFDNSIVNYANSAGAVAWGNVTGKPSTFTPSSHTHDNRYYTESEVDSKLSGKANSSHNHTISQITDIANASVKSATSATTAASAQSVEWNNVKNKPSTYTPSSHSHDNSTITSLDAGKITTGTIDIDRLPKGALERCVIVADDTARFKLTKSNVQIGDTVKVTGTGKMYFVIDDSKLTSEDGYTVYTAGSATAVPWSGITGKPATYPPSSHNHDNSYLKLTGGTLSGTLNISGTAASKPLRTRGIVGSDGNGSDGELHLQFGANNVIKLGNEAAYSISADGGTYTGKANASGTADVAKVANSVAWANVSGKPSTFTPATHNHNIEGLTNFSAHVYDATISRTANTVLAAPNGSNGTASFRKLVAADLPSHNHDSTYLKLSGGTITGDTSFTKGTASTSMTTGTVKVTGGVGVTGRVSAKEVSLGDGAVISYNSTNKCIDFTFN